MSSILDVIRNEYSTGGKFAAEPDVHVLDVDTHQRPAGYRARTCGHAPRLEPGDRVKFVDMPFGTWFTDGRRLFVKLQSMLPSGIIPIYLSIEADNRHKKAWPVSGGPFHIGFNAVDSEGITATCPGWLEFTVCATPAPRVD